MTTLSERLDEGSLRDLAGDRSFQRGVNYFEEGRVHALAQYGDRITAKVYGTHTDEGSKRGIHPSGNDAQAYSRLTNCV
ncbi:SWIM zinc finger family protein [Trichothermofontia sp.]